MQRVFTRQFSSAQAPDWMNGSSKRHVFEQTETWSSKMSRLLRYWSSAWSACPQAFPWMPLPDCRNGALHVNQSHCFAPKLISFIASTASSLYSSSHRRDRFKTRHHQSSRQPSLQRLQIRRQDNHRTSLFRPSQNLPFHLCPLVGAWLDIHRPYRRR
jgi:hypothetical protein